MHESDRFRSVKIFISWSGDRSREVALALRDWLPDVINSLEPFVSSKDIYAGSRWQAEIASQLEASNFGVICVTHANQHASWLNFEAGALAKAVESTRVVPLAIDLKPSDIEMPLAQFQAQEATETGVADLLTSLNAACPSPLESSRLDNAVKTWWPQLREKLEAIERATPTSTVPSRTERELLEELLDTVRTVARLVPEDRIASSGEVRDPVRGALSATLRMIGSMQGGEAAVMLRSPRSVIVQTEDPPSRDLMRAIRDLWESFEMGVHFASLPEDEDEPEPV
jgi:hypothetical protein